MKTMFLGTCAAVAISAAAMAQVADVTGTVQGTLQGTVDQTADVTTDLNATTNTMVDTRSGLAINQELTTELGTRLNAFDRASADAQLRAELDANAAAYRPEVRRPPRVIGRSAYTTGSFVSRTRGRTEYADIYVYSRDGYRIGTVNRLGSRSDNRIWIDPIWASGRGSIALDTNSVSYDAEANAVISNMGRAQFESMAVAG